MGVAFGAGARLHESAVLLNVFEARVFRDGSAHLLPVYFDLVAVVARRNLRIIVVVERAV